MTVGVVFFTVKNKYPLPLISSALHSLHRELLSSANSVGFLGYIIESGQVKTDLEKIQAVAVWILGFAKFCQCFIWNYSWIAAALTRLTSSSISFSWTPEAEEAFVHLKELFTSAPILVQPDPSRKFMVEVDALDIGMGAVLSQHSGQDQKLHPCAFFSRHFSPAECNYNTGNCELLDIKLALGKWRHWLEVTELLFVVWTDHKNLAYIQSAKRLNFHQACGALF